MTKKLFSFPLSSPTLFAALFALNIAAGLFVMMVLPHLFPAGHLGMGLFIGDSTSIHEGAVRVLEAWRTRGLSASLLLEYPALYDWLVASVYFLFSTHPLSFLPIQAGSMALAGTLFYRMLLKIGFTGLASTVGAVWLALNPQTFEWSTQLLRDGIFLVAILIYLTAYFSKERWRSALLGLTGCLLVITTRPHWIRVLLAAGLLLALFQLFQNVFRRAQPAAWIPKSNVMIPLIFPAFIYLCFREMPESYGRIFASYEVVNREARVAPTRLHSSSGILPSWREFHPPWLNNTFFEIYNLRLERIKIGGRSIIDEHRFLNSPKAQIGYLPRALQIGLFAPFPQEIWQAASDGRVNPELEKIRAWPQEGLGRTTTRLAREFMPWLTLICSLSMLGVTLALADAQKRPGMIWLTLFCVPQLMLLAMVSPNLGTLVRLRYPFYAPLVCLGLAAWLDWLGSRNHRLRSPS